MRLKYIAKPPAYTLLNNDCLSLVQDNLPASFSIETKLTIILSPIMKNGNYILSIEVLGEHPKWSDKRFSKYGSTDNYVVIQDVFENL